MCGSIPSRNWTVVIIVVKLILCAIPYEEGYVSVKGCVCVSERVFVVDGSLLLLFSKFIGAVGVSVVDSIKLGRGVSVGEISCGSTGCLSCQGKQSTSLLLYIIFNRRHY